MDANDREKSGIIRRLHRLRKFRVWAELRGRRRVFSSLTAYIRLKPQSADNKKSSSPTTQRRDSSPQRQLYSRSFGCIRGFGSYLSASIHVHLRFGFSAD